MTARLQLVVLAVLFRTEKIKLQKYTIVLVYRLCNYKIKNIKN